MASTTRNWAVAQHNLLVQLKSQGASWDEIYSRFPNRSRRAIRSKWDRMNGLQANGTRRVPQILRVTANGMAIGDGDDDDDDDNFEDEREHEGDADNHSDLDELQVDRDVEQQADIGAADALLAPTKTVEDDNGTITIGDTNSSDSDSSSEKADRPSSTVNVMDIDEDVPAEAQALYDVQIAMLDTAEANARAGIRSAELAAQSSIDQLFQFVHHGLGLSPPANPQVISSPDELRNSQVHQATIATPESTPFAQNISAGGTEGDQDTASRSTSIVLGAQLRRERMQRNANRFTQGLEPEPGSEHERHLDIPTRSAFDDQLAGNFDGGQHARGFVDPQVIHLFPENAGPIHAQAHRELVETFGADTVVQAATRATATWMPTTANSRPFLVDASFMTALSNAEIERLQTVVRQSSDYHGVTGYWQMLVLQDYPQYSDRELDATYHQLRERNPALPWNVLPWLPVEDSFLTAGVEQHRHSWRVIGYSIRRSPYQCEDRYRFLQERRGINMGPPPELLDLTPMFINDEMLE